ncbi:MAG: cation diffusion facilitator family transporter [Thermoplasmata archaeon]|jgi:cation diffusion facilitator family transporter|nr:cation diffusion facilitator family transporter [Thermoplasmata archaeon]
MDAAAEKVAVARLSVYSNTGLVILKVVIGVLMGSVSVLSEAIHSGIDLVAAMIARYSVKRSAEPADADHRYGHGKFENFSGMVEGALIFIAAAWIVYEASKRLFDENPVELVGAGLVVMGVSTVVNYMVSRKLFEVAKRTDSLALEADAYHLRTDVWTSLGVFVALGLILVTGIQILDPIVAIMVAMFIVKAAFEITRRSTEGLLDVSLPKNEMDAIERVMNEHSADFVNFHRLRARKMGSERQIDLHVTVPRQLTVEAGHSLVTHLEEEIKKLLPGSILVIHIEPCKADCERCGMAGSKPVFRGKS